MRKVTVLTPSVLALSAGDPAMLLINSIEGLTVLTLEVADMGDLADVLLGSFVLCACDSDGSFVRSTIRASGHSFE